MTETQTRDETKATRASVIATIAGKIGHKDFPTGDRAALRRLDPENPSYGGLAVVLRVMRNAGAKIDGIGDDHLARWVLLVHAMSLMSAPDRSPHAKGDSGGVLHEAGYSEARLMRLLEARGTTRDGLLIRLARFLAAKNLRIDWTGLARLVLDDEDGEGAERTRLALARGYYAAEARENKSENGE